MGKFLSFLAVLVAAYAGGGSHAPLPKALMEAKTAYVLDESWHSSVGDDCRAELSKWGRFKVVSDQKEADLVFHLTGTVEDLTTLDVVDAHTQERLLRSKPGKTRKLINELRKRIEGQERR